MLPDGALAVCEACQCGLEAIEIYDIASGEKSQTIQLVAREPRPTHISIALCNKGKAGYKDADLLVLPDGRLLLYSSLRVSLLAVYR